MKDRSEGLGMWDLFVWMTMGLLLLAGLFLVWFWYMPVIQKNDGMRREIIALEKEKTREQEESRQLEESINALQTDRETSERLARETLGYAGANENVARFEEADDDHE